MTCCWEVPSHHLNQCWLVIIEAHWHLAVGNFTETVLNTLRPRQNGRHFADDIFKCIFLNENVWIPIKISLKFVPQGLINNIPALVQIMAWRRPGDKPLSGPMMVRLPTHIWVNITDITQYKLVENYSFENIVSSSWGHYFDIYVLYSPNLFSPYRWVYTLHYCQIAIDCVSTASSEEPVRDDHRQKMLLRVSSTESTIDTRGVLTHWGRVTHICVSELTIIGSDNGLPPGRRQAIIWNNAGLLNP